MDISDRNRKILEAIINDYIVTAEPVGSRTVAKKYRLDLSPATIRNVMADLEEMGLLIQPHISAGRIPTEKAFRFYIDTILEVKGLTEAEQSQIEQQYIIRAGATHDILRNTSKILSMLSQHIGVVLAPRVDEAILKHIEFIRLSGPMVLVILVTTTGMIQNKIIEIEEDILQEELNKLTKYLDEVLSGMTLKEAREKIIEEMKNEKNLYDKMLTKALELSQKALAFEQDTEVFIEGQSTIIEEPEFADVEKMKAIFKTFEEKSKLVKLLDKAVEANEIQIFIGSEIDVSKGNELSLIFSPYQTGKNTIGAIGVIGPMRMDYSKVIPIVDYTAKLISRLLEFEVP